MSSKIKKYLNSRFYRIFVIVYIVFIFVVVVFSIDIFNSLRSFTNKSDSMDPVINQGSITIVKNFSQYEIGEVIAYYSQIDGQEEIVTHRIKAVGGNVYTTKGDANEVADRELVKPRLVIGKVIYIIPWLGYLITFVKSLIGTWLCIIIPAILIISSELIRINLELSLNSKEKNS